MTRFRPCIDLHNGQVKQIVGGTLDTESLKTNFVSTHQAEWYACLYKERALEGAHVIALGPGNETAALSALSAWPGGLQFGGGVNLDNAQKWIDAGASHVIVTSWLFVDGHLDWSRVEALANTVGKERVVIDLSCRRTDMGWQVATDRWRVTTPTVVDAVLLQSLSQYCDEFLVHAADVEGLCKGMDTDLIALLGTTSPLPVTYAGGASSLDDLELVRSLSDGRVDLTIGSALDLFGGTLSFDACVAWNKSQH